MALCAATLIVAGCVSPKMARIEHQTDANGKRVRSFVIKPSGDDEADKVAVAAAARHFRRQVPKPLKSHRYRVDVDVYGLVEPAWPSEKPSD